MSRPSCPLRICRSAPISRTASATHRKRRRRRSSWPPPRVWRAARSKILPASSGSAAAGRRVYDIAHAADRIRAAAAVVRNLPFRFTLTARAENFIAGNPDLKDTIARLQAYQEAGADVLYAPGLTSKDDIATVVRAVDRPVNVLMGLQGSQLSLADLSTIGVKRISVGSALSRAALGAFLRAADEMRNHGTFTFANDAISYRDITKMFESMR